MAGGVPKGIREAFKESAASGVRLNTGTEGWLKTLSPARRKEFDTTLREYLKLRGCGKLALSLSSLVRALRTEFKYPFGVGALRNHMSRRYPTLFDAQVVK